MDFTEFVERIGKATDLAGVALIIAGALIATGLFLHWLVRMMSAATRSSSPRRIARPSAWR